MPGVGVMVITYAVEATALVVMPVLVAIALTVVVPVAGRVILNEPLYLVEAAVGAELSRV